MAWKPAVAVAFLVAGAAVNAEELSLVDNEVDNGRSLQSQSRWSHKFKGGRHSILRKRFTKTIPRRQSHFGIPKKYGYDSAEESGEEDNYTGEPGDVDGGGADKYDMGEDEITEKPTYSGWYYKPKRSTRRIVKKFSYGTGDHVDSTEETGYGSGEEVAAETETGYGSGEENMADPETGYGSGQEEMPEMETGYGSGQEEMPDMEPGYGTGSTPGYVKPSHKKYFFKHSIHKKNGHGRISISVRGKGSGSSKTYGHAKASISYGSSHHKPSHHGPSLLKKFFKKKAHKAVDVSVGPRKTYGYKKFYYGKPVMEKETEVTDGYLEDDKMQPAYGADEEIVEDTTYPEDNTYPGDPMPVLVDGEKVELVEFEPVPGYGGGGTATEEVIMNEYGDALVIENPGYGADGEYAIVDVPAY